MDVKNSLALRKKRELLGTINKRKMSLRKHMDSLKPNECRLDITQITKCVFLGSLCLKPVPQLFDSPLLLEELDMKVGNVRNVNNENVENPKAPNNQTSTKKVSRKKSLNLPKVKKKSLRERNESKIMNEMVVIKAEISPEVRQPTPDIEDTLVPTIDDNNEIPPTETLFQKVEPRDLTVVNDNNNGETSFQESNNIKESYIDLEIDDLDPLLPDDQPYEFHEELSFDETLLNLKLSHNRKPPVLTKPPIEESPPDIKVINSIALHYEDVERMKREPTPELILSDSDEDAIDQLMFNIMDIKVGPNVFEKDFFEMPSPEVEEFTEYSNDVNEKEDLQEKPVTISSKKSTYAKKLMKRHPQCKICSQVFSNYIQLKKHKAAHNGDKPYLCLKCNENHTTLDQLIAHLRTHQGKRPYVCKKCNKGFKTTRALENHQPVHVLRKAVVQKKAFKCEVCGKEFRKLCDLERHTRVHTGEKPSVCNICNRRFQQAHNLNKHLLIHTKEKPYECDICNKKFGRNDVLNRHLLTHSVKKPNDCNICMKSFIRVSQLIAHKEKYHSSEAS